MSDRREEKYLITYPEYVKIRNRVASAMTPDENGKSGAYSICSLYFDDEFDTAFYEKEDGLAVHTKFRIRTYGGDKSFIRLERKTKRGLVTEKVSAMITESELDAIIKGLPVSSDAECFGLVSEMYSKGLRPAVNVRYDREAYIYEPLGIRVTFDINIDSLPCDKEVLFGDTHLALPALSRNEIVMEIKYSEKCPAFVRKLCETDGMQLSVSKYALCRSVRTHK